MSNRIERFYNVTVQREWDRLAAHRTEFAVTLRVLAGHLPPPPARILDIGGGPGRYAIELCRQGYRVTLVDLAQSNLDFAQHKAHEAGVELAGAIHANALDLRLPDETPFDAVLLMGPLYHLLEEADRRRAVGRALAHLKPDGTLFAAFICRFASIRKCAALAPELLPQYRDLEEGILATGQVILGDDALFTDAYLVHPTEIVPFMESCGLHTLDLIGVEGGVAFVEEKINQLDGDLWEEWVALNVRLGRDPSLHGAAEHLLYVGKITSRPHKDQATS